jgi:hypothetical protein
MNLRKNGLDEAENGVEPSFADPASDRGNDRSAHVVINE